MGHGLARFRTDTRSRPADYRAGGRIPLKAAGAGPTAHCLTSQGVAGRLSVVGTADLDFVRRMAGEADYFATVATTRADGSVHASVVKAGILDDPETGEPVIGIVLVGGARKTEHIRRSKRAAAVFQRAGQWVAVEGPARLVGPDAPAPTDVPALLRDIFVAAGGTHDDWSEYDRVMAEDRRAAVLIVPERVTTRG
jgi:PPOX class probable F420-dependent enzyme